MKISVALATYNGSRYLREQLASLAGQTLLPDELVISDDGSTDNTLEIVREFAVTAPFPVRILSKPARLGFADNFLHAAEACRHEAIALCDQDDIWLPTKLEVEAARLYADRSLIVLHTLTVTDELLKPTGLHWTQDIERDEVHEPLQIDPYCIGWGNTMMFRRELVHLIDRHLRPRQPESPDRPLSHDTWIYTLAAALGRVSHIARPLILYRQHGSNAAGFIGWRPRTKLEEIAKIEVVRHREQALITAQLSKLFEQLGNDDSAFAPAARAAAAAFTKRHQRSMARALMFDGASFSSRLQAYRDFHGAMDGKRPWLGSRIKTLLLGVSGVVRLTRPASTQGG